MAIANKEACLTALSTYALMTVKSFSQPPSSITIVCGSPHVSHLFYASPCRWGCLLATDRERLQIVFSTILPSRASVLHLIFWCSVSMRLVVHGLGSSTASNVCISILCMFPTDLKLLLIYQCMYRNPVSERYALVDTGILIPVNDLISRDAKLLESKYY